MIQLGIKYPSFVDDNIACELIELIIKNGTKKEQIIQAQNWNRLNLVNLHKSNFLKYQPQINKKIMNISETTKGQKLLLNDDNKNKFDYHFNKNEEIIKL